jgi:hypothetical protein
MQICETDIYQQYIINITWGLHLKWKNNQHLVKDCNKVLKKMQKDYF